MKPLEAAVALIEREGRCFLQRRDASSRNFPGLWEFPGGKLEPGERPEDALYRELEEELRWTPEAVEEVEPISFAYPERDVLLHPFRCHGAGPLHCALAWGWFLPAEIGRLRLPGASRVLLMRMGG